MSRRDIKFAQHYVECTQCEANAEYYCNTCTDNLCQVCRDRHTKSKATRSHVIVPYQERELTSPNTESCHIHPEFSYEMACQECKLPICIRCMKENHEGHTFKSIKDTLKDTEKPCRDKIQTAKKNILPKLRDRLKKLSDQRTKSKEKRTDIRRRLREDAKQIKDLVDTILEEKLGDINIGEKSQDEEFENQTGIISRFISNYEDFIDGFEDEEKGPYEKLALRNEILQSEVTEPELPSIENPQYHPEIIKKDAAMKLFGKVIVRVLNKKNNCQYIWTEEKFRDSLAAMNDYDETEDDDDSESRIDPFDIDCVTSYTPVGTSFIDIRPLSSNQSVPKTTLPVVDASAKNIGKISFSVDICSSNWAVQNRPRRVPSENLIKTPMYLRIRIHQIKFEDDMGEKYTEIKCSFRLPNTSEEDDDDTEYVETTKTKGEVSIFNFIKQWKIPSVNGKHLEFFNDVLFVRVWGIPRPVAGLQVSRGNLREVTELLAKEENKIRILKEEKRVLQEKVDELTRAINRQKPPH